MHSVRAKSIRGHRSRRRWEEVDDGRKEGGKEIAS
jgi:hypothetical protein